MGLRFAFPEESLNTILYGVSAIDHRRLEIHDLEHAYRFVLSYGFDLNKAKDIEEVWYYHRKAVSLIREHLLEEKEIIPDVLTDPAKLQDICHLLIAASSSSDIAEAKEHQRWACAILRVMHAFAHIQNDIFSQFSDQIQEQVLRRYKEFIVEDPVMGVTFGNTKSIDQISLHKFDIKPFKRTSSSVIKLLSKPKAVAFSLLDRLGVRFVTKNTVDAFRVIRFLVNEHIISLPNVMPEQSNNTLYPANLFLELAKKNEQSADRASGQKFETYEDLDKEMIQKIKQSPDRAEFLVKKNDFSSDDYKFMKFIARQLIQVEHGGKPVHFFFPYEVQILDYTTYIKNLSGEKAHDEYKKRQKLAARKRTIWPQ